MAIVFTPYAGLHLKVDAELSQAQPYDAALLHIIVGVFNNVDAEAIAVTAIPALVLDPHPSLEQAVYWVQRGIDWYNDELKEGKEKRIDHERFQQAAAYAVLTHVTASIKHQSDNNLETWQKMLQIIEENEG